MKPTQNRAQGKREPRNPPPVPRATQVPSEPRRAGPKHAILVGSAAVVLLLAFVVGAFVYRDAQSAREAERNVAVLVRAHSPTVGSPTAKVHIVEFLDPACGTCRSFYPFVKRIIAANPGRIRLSVRHVAFHKGADDVVRMLEAARKQDKYWQALDAVLASQPAWVQDHVARADLVWPQLERAGLDLDRLRADMASPEVAERMAQDAADARTMKISATPEYFVNGEPLPSFGYDELQELVSRQLAAAYR